MIQITEHSDRGGNRGYDSVEEREEDVKRLQEEGFDHFVHYRDSQASITLAYGKRDRSRERPLITRRPWQPKPGDRGYDLLC